MRKFAHPIQRHLLILFGIIVSIGVFFLAFNIISQTGKQSCSIQDSLYKTISTNSLDWTEYFFHSPESSTTTHVDFSTESGQQFTAIKIEDVNQFFVVTEYDYPHTYLGSKGYMFSPDSSPKVWNEYRFTQISDGVYCYEKK